MVISAHSEGRLRGWIRSAAAAIPGSSVGAIRLELHQPQELGSAIAAGQVVFGNAEARQVVLRQVDAAASRILADVAQNIGELKSDSAFFRQCGALGVSKPKM